MSVAGNTAVNLKRNDSNVYYSPQYLVATEKNMVFDKFGTPKDLPKNSGRSITFREFVPNSAITTITPLVEGIPPSPLAITMREVRFAIDELGNYLRATNRVFSTFEDGAKFLSEQESWLGRYRAEERDTYIFQTVRAGTQVQRAGGVGARSSIQAVLSESLLHLAERALSYGTDGRPAMEITSIVSASQNFGSVGIEPAYVAVVHPDLVYDIRQIPGFNSVENYGSNGGSMVGEIGKAGKFRFVKTTQAVAWADAGGAVAGLNLKSTTGTSADVYPVLIFGKDAFVLVKLAMEAEAQMIYKPLGSAGVADPLNQVATLGYRHDFTAGRTFEHRMIRLEVAATATPA